MCVIAIGNISVGHVFTLCVDTVIGQLCVMETNCLSQKYSYTLPTLSALIIKMGWHFFPTHIMEAKQDKGIEKNFRNGKNQSRDFYHLVTYFSQQSLKIEQQEWS